MPRRLASFRATLRVLVPLAFLVAPLPACQPSAELGAVPYSDRQEAAVPAPEELDFSDLLERFGVPGASVAVIRDFEVHSARGYGVADATNGRPVEVGTLIQAASISKPVTAMAALRLAQEGRFGIDDDVNDLLVS